MHLWLPEHEARDALGALPDAVHAHTYALDRAPPDEISNAEFLVALSSERWLGELLPEMARLRVLQTISAGVDWILPLAPPGVTLCSARGTRDAAVAEWVLGAVLACRKGLVEMHTHQLEHRWEWEQPGDLTGATVAILGYGSIGAAVEERMSPFGVEFLRIARRARPDVHTLEQLPRLLAQSDILIVLLPLTARTRGLLGSELLARLAPGALLVNAARGAIVDTAALVELTRDGRLRAALDVTDPEPLPAGHPLWDTPGVLITPHVAGDSRDADRRAFHLVGEQVRRWVAGERLVNVVADGY